MGIIDTKTSIQDLKDQFSSLKVWKRGNNRAPHKPLLVLLTLAHIQQGRERMILYEEIAEPLRNLLTVFGNKYHHTNLPFYHLQSDKIWEVEGSEPSSHHGKSVPKTKSQLISGKFRGGFTQEVYEALKRDNSLLVQIAQLTLDQHFTSGLHQEILDSTGLSMELESSMSAKSSERRRDPKFRKEVLNAYGWKCSICAFDMGLGGQHFGLEAAHIHWWCFDGPDEVTNGLALCANHHKAFDLGAITVSEDYNVTVSGQLHGLQSHHQYMGNLNGKQIYLPHSSSYYPSEDRLKWHRKNVFREPAMDIS